MKRAMELVRKIVFAIEQGPHGFAARGFKIDGYTDEQVGYHVYIMIEAGLIEGTDTTAGDSESPEALPRSLTWYGHEFADASRDDNRWKKAMDFVKEKAGAVGIGVLMELLTHYSKTALGLS